MKKTVSTKLGPVPETKAVNPWLARVAEAAAEAAGVEKLWEQARDEFLLASARARAFLRQDADSLVVDGEVAGLVSRATGNLINPAEYRRLERRCQEAEAAYTRASDALRAANSKLHKLQKAAERWEIHARYAADQAAQRAAETPQERETRLRREIEQEVLAARAR